MSRSQGSNFLDVTKEMCDFNLKSKAKKERKREKKRSLESLHHVCYDDEDNE